MRIPWSLLQCPTILALKQRCFSWQANERGSHHRSMDLMNGTAWQISINSYGEGRGWLGRTKGCSDSQRSNQWTTMMTSKCRRSIGRHRIVRHWIGRLDRWHGEQIEQTEGSQRSKQWSNYRWRVSVDMAVVGRWGWIDHRIGWPGWTGPALFFDGSDFFPSLLKSHLFPKPICFAH